MEIIKSLRKNLEIKAAQLIARKIRTLLKSQPNVVLGIPGGASVTGVFNLLRKQSIPWKKVQIFMVDERLVSLDHPDSNYGLAYNSFIRYLIKQNKFPKQNAHPFIYHRLSEKTGIDAYKTELKLISDKFDIVLLSSGEDGHVASLFPNHETVKNSGEFFIMTSKSPKLPRKRISASRKLLQKSRTAILLFFGEKKRTAYSNFRDFKMSVLDCPAKLIYGIEDNYVFTDLE